MRDLLARYRALREDHLRYLVKCGILRPVLSHQRRYVFRVSRSRRSSSRPTTVSTQGASFRGIVRTLMASRQGQLELDFRLDAAPAKILTLRRPASSPPPRASRRTPVRRPPASRSTTPRSPRSISAPPPRSTMATKSTQDEAAAAYRKALELDPYLVAALINLANIHYSRDELVEAQALYERAIGLESDFFEAHFNLGNIYHDLGRFPEAQACYREALRLNPFYADAHFYLAVTFEKMGLSQEARPHWRAYQQLAPQGEWVELAKEFSE